MKLYYIAFTDQGDVTVIWDGIVCAEDPQAAFAEWIKFYFGVEEITPESIVEALCLNGELITPEKPNCTTPLRIYEVSNDLSTKRNFCWNSDDLKLVATLGQPALED